MTNSNFPDFDTMTPADFEKYLPDFFANGDGHVSSLTYDADNNVLTSTDGDHNVTSYTYNGADEAIKEVLKDAHGSLVRSLSWSYDPNGNVTSRLRR